MTGDSVEWAYRNQVRAWSFHQGANHAYITVTATTFFPPYSIAVAAALQHDPASQLP